MKLTHITQRFEVVALDDKLQALTQRKSDLEARLYKAAKSKEDEERGAIDQLLADPGASLAKREDPDQLRQELAQVNEAISRLRQERASTVSRLSKQVCSEHNAELKKRVQRVLSAAKEITAANASVRELFDELGSQGYGTGNWRLMQFLDTGSASDPNSPLAFFERECREFGFLDNKLTLSGVVGQ